LGVGGSLDLCVGTERSATSETSASILRRDQLDVDVDLIESQHQLNFNIYSLEQCRCQQHIRGLDFDKSIWVLDSKKVFDELELEPVVVLEQQ